jgi:protein-tyrosine phosphatase
MTPVFNINSGIAIMSHPQGRELLSAEIKQLGSMGFDTLVCLLTQEEISLLGLEKEKEECASRNIKFIHFPVADFGVPGEMQEMISLAEALNAEISKGKKVIAHCRGGIGRSSLLACALLMQQGITCKEAIALVSKKRDRKVPETAEQEAWLEKLHTTIGAKKAS